MQAMAPIVIFRMSHSPFRINLRRMDRCRFDMFPYALELPGTLHLG
jgi:hypothetical protein